MDAVSTEQLEAWWAAHFGCEREALWQPGTFVTAHAVSGLNDYWGLWVVGRAGTVRISTPPHWMSGVSRAVLRKDQHCLMTPAFWTTLLGRDAARVLGPAVHAFTDAPPQSVGLRAKLLEPTELHLLGELRAACPSAEWEESGVSELVGPIFAVLERGRVVAASMLKSWRDAPTDINLVTHPAARGRGHGLEVAAAAVRYACERSSLVRYRALEANLASRAVARRLGFEDYARQLAVRFAVPAT